MLSAIVTVAALVVVFGTWFASPAAAHEELRSSSPMADEQMSEPPTEIMLEYSRAVMQIGTQVLVTSSEGTRLDVAAPEFVDARVVTKLPGDIPAGAYTAAWRVVSSDGHPISGVVRFAVGDVPGGAAPQPGATSTPSAEVAASGQPAAPSWLRPVLIGGGGAAVALAIFVIAARPKKPSGTA